jgi:hypothetical protein
MSAAPEAMELCVEPVAGAQSIEERVNPSRPITPLSARTVSIVAIISLKGRAAFMPLFLATVPSRARGRLPPRESGTNHTPLLRPSGRRVLVAALLQARIQVDWLEILRTELQFREPGWTRWTNRNALPR